MIDTAGTITEARRSSVNAGADGSDSSRDASDTVGSAWRSPQQNRTITEIVTTNTIPLRAKAQTELTKLHPLFWSRACWRKR